MSHHDNRLFGDRKRDDHICVREKPEIKTTSSNKPKVLTPRSPTSSQFFDRLQNLNQVRVHLLFVGDSCCMQSE
jgi:hypothetical protein